MWNLSLVRLPSIGIDLIKVLDFGAKGLIIPNVSSLDDIKKLLIIPITHQRDQEGRPFTANKYGKSFNEYYKWQNNNYICSN